jgi:hypothetical protein
MPARKDRTRTRLQLQSLEDRLSPATLTVRPPGFVNIEGDLIVAEVSDAAQPGLTTAQAHSGGVVAWSLAGRP